MMLLYLLANECMALLTIAIAFPGILPPKKRLEWILTGMMMIPMSLVWWLYLAVAPFAFLLLYLIGDWKPSDCARKWPWRLLRRAR